MHRVLASSKIGAKVGPTLGAGTPISYADTLCKCNEAYGASLDYPTGFRNVLDVDLPGNDIPCNGKSFCKVCGSAEALAKACKQNNRCVSFTYDISAGCGYLKSLGDANAFSNRKGWAAFVPSR